MTGRNLLVIGLLALAVRLINLVFFPIDFGHLVFHDAEMFWHGSEAMVRLGAYVTQGDVPQVERVPIYFFFLAGLRWLFGPSFLAILLAQCLIDALTCMLIAALGARLGARIGMVSGVLAMLWPNLIIHTTYILSESLFLFFFTGVLLGGVRFIEAPSLRRAALLGLLLGLATMTRTVTQFLILVLPFTVLVAGLMRGEGRRAVAEALVALLLATAPLAPLLVRNRISYGSWQLTAHGGNHLLYWVVPSVLGQIDGRSRDAIGAEMTARLEEALKALPTDAQGNRLAVDQVRGRIALEELARAPIGAVARAWAEGAAQNLLSPALPLDPRVYLLPHPSLMDMSGQNLLEKTRAYLVASSPAFAIALGLGLAGSALTALLQLAGFVLLIRRQAWAASLGALCIAYFLAVSGPIGSAKYRIPFEPVLIVFTAIAVSSLGSRRTITGR